jgi:hypothetical protein
VGGQGCIVNVGYYQEKKVKICLENNLDNEEIG